jgi:hypothetical protein
MAELDRSAPFVISLEREIYTDPAGKASDRELSGGAIEVLAAGRWVVQHGRLLVITNESPAYHPSVAQMQAALEHLDAAGIDLTGDGGGVLVIVYATINRHGRGKQGKRYRAKKTVAGITLVSDNA